MMTFPAPRDGAWLVDMRALGVSIAELVVDYDDRRLVNIALDDPRLAIGFYGVEEGWRRWTKRRVWLAPDLFGKGAWRVRIARAEHSPLRWVAPAAKSKARAA